MDDFSAYPEYRKARLPWVAEIPAYWEENRGKFYFREVDDRSKTGKEELLSVSHITGVTPRSQKNVSMFKAENYSDHKLCQPGDIIVNTMWAWMAALGVSSHCGIVSPSYGMYRCYNDSDFNPRYLDYLLRTQPYVSEYICRSTGIRSSRLRLYPDKFLDMPFIKPPRDEQDKIVAYLRVQDAHIARFIKAKRELIGLLNEQKQTLIHQAVTKGIDPNVALKPSGIDWLGDIPEHWEVRKLKFVTRRIVGGSTPKSDQSLYWGGNIVWVTPKDVSKSDSLSRSLRTLTLEGLQSCSASLVPAGSIVITSRAPVGNIAIAGTELCTNQGCKAIVPMIDRLTSDYLYLILQRMKDRLQVLANGTTFAEIGTSVLANEFVPVPSLSEQETICRWVNDECAPIVAATQRAEEENKLIYEYRERLITDAVTGQIDLRNWQPGPDDNFDDNDLGALSEGDELASEEDADESD
jgi:type I restriction enzyme S subunit